MDERDCVEFIEFEIKLNFFTLIRSNLFCSAPAGHWEATTFVSNNFTFFPGVVNFINQSIFQISDLFTLDIYCASRKV